jgi:hypothetical protein
MTADQDSPNILLAGSQPRVFSNVGVLLWPDLWFEWLKAHPGHATLLAAAHGALVKLSSHTAWEQERVLDRLGCDTKSEDKFLELSEGQMRLCSDYFEWVESLLCNLDLASDKRLAVSGAARFFAAAEKDLDRCRAVMRAGGFSPLEYLKLGEVAQSWQSAIRGLDGARGERARHTEAANPFIDESTPHLSPKRLDMLPLKDSQHLLGASVEERIHEHLEHCPVCEAAAFERRAATFRRRRRGLASSPV